MTITSHSDIDPVYAAHHASEFDHVMIDIETMSLHPSNALILSIGMIEFDPTGYFTDAKGISDLKLGVQALIIPNIAQQFLLGREVSASTQRFWMDQAFEARAHWADASHGTMALPEVCKAVRNFCAHKKRVWANGTQFDLSNLVELNHQLGNEGQPDLWHYQAPRDMRTFVKETSATRIIPIGEAFDIAGVPHEPIYDCITQAWQVWAHWQQ